MKREREREREKERESVENQTTWSTPAPRLTPSPLFLPSLPFASHPSLRSFSLYQVAFLCSPFVRPTFHASLTKAHATIYSHFAPQPRGDFSSFCHNFGIIKIYGHPYANHWTIRVPYPHNREPRPSPTGLRVSKYRNFIVIFRRSPISFSPFFPWNL